jgi:N-acyl-D-amino-acid deacylase
MMRQIRKTSAQFLVLLLIANCLQLSLFAQNTQTIYDIVIRNGKVLDGGGNPWILADVAIKDGKFVRIGRIEGRGTREIDARGKYVSPGWIDVMDQSGSVLPQNGLAENKLMMGVTTAIGGEGGTPVPADRIAEYFADLEKKGISINFGSYYSETQARVAVLGQKADAPTPEELEKMKALMETAMKNGAMGMTTALIYPPSSYAKTDELIEMAKVAGKYGGIYASHIRDEGSGLVGAVEEAITIGEKGGLPVEIFHLKAAYQPGWGKLMKEAGERIEQARMRGVDVAADIYLYPAGGTGLEATIPSWAFEGGSEKLFERLKDPAIRARLKAEQKTGSPGWWNIIEAAGGWDGIILANAQNRENARFQGKSLSAIAKEMNKEPAEAAFDLILQAGGKRVYALSDFPGQVSAVMPERRSNHLRLMPSACRIREHTEIFPG